MIYLIVNNVELSGLLTILMTPLANFLLADRRDSTMQMMTIVTMMNVIGITTPSITASAGPSTLINIAVRSIAQFVTFATFVICNNCEIR